MPISYSIAPACLEDIESKSEQNASKNIWNKDMATLYLIVQGTAVYKENLRFVIWVDDEPRKEIPIREVERILVFGNIQVSTQAIHACLQEHILILFLNLSGYYKGHLWNWESSHLGNELVQIEKRRMRRFSFKSLKLLCGGSC